MPNLAARVSIFLVEFFCMSCIENGIAHGSCLFASNGNSAILATEILTF
jgi:hypothetical protein